MNNNNPIYKMCLNNILNHHKNLSTEELLDPDNISAFDMVSTIAISFAMKSDDVMADYLTLANQGN